MTITTARAPASSSWSAVSRSSPNPIGCAEPSSAPIRSRSSWPPATDGPSSRRATMTPGIARRPLSRAPGPSNASSHRGTRRSPIGAGSGPNGPTSRACSFSGASGWSTTNPRTRRWFPVPASCSYRTCAPPIPMMATTRRPRAARRPSAGPRACRCRGARRRCSTSRCSGTSRCATSASMTPAPRSPASAWRQRSIAKRTGQTRPTRTTR